VHLQLIVDFPEAGDTADGIQQPRDFGGEYRAA
jgi:hypothetical protein